MLLRRSAAASETPVDEAPRVEKKTPASLSVLPAKVLAAFQASEGTGSGVGTVAASPPVRVTPPVQVKVRAR